MGFINSCTFESILSIIGKKNSSKELWEALESSLSSKERSRVSDLLRQLHTAMKGIMSTDEYVNFFKKLTEELALASYPIDDVCLMFAFLRGLGLDYMHFNISMNANLENLTFDKLRMNLKSHEACLTFYNHGSSNNHFPPMSNSNVMAPQQQNKNNRNFAQHKGENQNDYNNRGGRHNRGRGKNWKGNKYTPRCQICGLWGHQGRECRERLNTQNFPALQQQHSTPQAYVIYQNAPTQSSMMSCPQNFMHQAGAGAQSQVHTGGARYPDRG